MKKKLLVARIVSMIIGILVGVLVLVLGSLLTAKTVETIIKWGLIIYGIIIIIGNVPGLVSSIANIKKGEAVFDLICSILGIGLGVALIFFQNEILVGLIAAYLIIFPLIRVLVAKEKVEQLKREALRMILGVVLVAFLPLLLSTAFDIVSLLLTISGWVVVALSVIFGVVEIVRICMGKETAESAPDAEHIVTDFEEKKD